MAGASDDLRLPKNYRLVEEVVREHATGRHLTTSDIYALARRRQPGIGATTVYRALNRLVAAGLIAEVLVPGAEHTFYEANASPHAHFRCESCGRVDDVDFSLPRTVVTRIARDLGYDVHAALVNLTGLCAACRAA